MKDFLYGIIIFIQANKRCPDSEDKKDMKELTDSFSPTLQELKKKNPETFNKILLDFIHAAKLVYKLGAKLGAGSGNPTNHNGQQQQAMFPEQIDLNATQHSPNEAHNH